MYSLQETVKNVKEAFEIDASDKVTFQTSNLDVCRDRLVDIEPSAYPHLWPVLDEIMVGSSPAGM